MAKKKNGTTKKEIGLFFGAGAEIDYGLPSGGQFALDIFRRPPIKQKKRFKELLQNIDTTMQYSARYLPSDYESKNINVFGKPDFTSLLQSSLEYRRDQVLNFLNNFDDMALKAMKSKGISHDLFEEKYNDGLGKSFGASNYSQGIKLNRRLGGKSDLFSSNYFSAFLDVLANTNEALLLRRCATSFLQLLVGSYSQELASDLNDQIFAKTPDDIPIFDDVAGLFQIEFSQAGLAALEIVLGNEHEEVNESSSLEVFAGQVCRAVLEKLFESCLDYQALIDSHFRYLYDPKASWAKFTKISIFLNVVREYICEGMPSVEDAKSSDGYYHDIEFLKEYGLDCKSAGTTNYNDLIGSVCGEASPEVFYLNGSVMDFYDPYLNQIVTLKNPEEEYTTQNHILVPLLFTQSGIKPLTSVEMSRRYVTLYDEFKKCDAIVIIGYGFNGDDGHINGLFRQLIQKEKKQIYVCFFKTDNFSESKARKEIHYKLRLESNAENLHIIPVNSERKDENELMWYEALSHELGSQ